MSSDLAAALTGFVGLCLIAGWLSGFRNRGYLGWLGLAFVCLAGAIWASGEAELAREMGAAANRPMRLGQVLLGVCVVAFVLAVLSAVQETQRRVREIRARHEAAEEALIEMLRAQRGKKPDPGPAEDEQP